MSMFVASYSYSLRYTATFKVRVLAVILAAGFTTTGEVKVLAVNQTALDTPTCNDS